MRPIKSTLVASIDSSTFKCGDTIVGQDSTQTYTVTTAPVAGGCQFSFDQDVELLSEADYGTIAQLKGLLRGVDRVEIEVQRMDFTNDVGDRLDPLSRIKDLELWVNGTQVLNTDQLSQLPRTITIEGDALAAIKQAVRNRQRCTTHVTARVTVLDTAAPTSLHCDFEAQPTLVLSTAAL